MKDKKKDKNFEQKKNIQYKKLFINFVGNYFNVAMIVIVLLVFVVAYIFILKPKFDKVSTVIAERHDLKLNNQTILENNLNIINRYKSDYNRIGDVELSKINAILPPFETTEEFFTIFEQMILKRGYLLTNLSVSSDAVVGESNKKKKSIVTKSKDPQIGTIAIQMSITGVDYEGMKKLLKLLENNLRIMDINSMSYSYSGETLNLGIDTYFLR